MLVVSKVILKVSFILKDSIADETQEDDEELNVSQMDINDPKEPSDKKEDTERIEKKVRVRTKYPRNVSCWY